MKKSITSFQCETNISPPSFQIQWQQELDLILLNVLCYPLKWSRLMVVYYTDLKVIKASCCWVHRMHKHSLESWVIKVARSDELGGNTLLATFGNCDKCTSQSTYRRKMQQVHPIAHAQPCHPFSLWNSDTQIYGSSLGHTIKSIYVNINYSLLKCRYQSSSPICSWAYL